MAAKSLTALILISLSLWPVAASGQIVIDELEYTISKYYPDECLVKIDQRYTVSADGCNLPVSRKIETPLEARSRVRINGEELRVTEVEWGGFEGHSFKSFTLPPTIVSVGDLGFSHTEAVFHMPGSIDVIGHYAFAGSKGKIKLDEGIRVIGDNAFGGFLPNSYWSETEVLAIPSTVESLGRTILGTDINGTTDAGFTELQCMALTPPEIEEGPDGETDLCSLPASYGRIALYVPDRSVNLYKQAPGWRKFKIIRPLSKSGIQSTAVTEAITISGREGRIIITCDNPEPIPVKVYTTDGRQIYFGYLREIPLTSGLYIVRASSTTAKVRL